MSCFIVPMVQAIATSAYCRKHPEKRKLKTLETMLWGGTVMLIVDHIINGELTWRFPFLTALGQTGGGEVVLRELLTVGLPISVVITLVWAVWALLKDKKAATASESF